MNVRFQNFSLNAFKLIYLDKMPEEKSKITAIKDSVNNFYNDPFKW